ncbi:MAG TPA: methionyl-tRNA formyltransferase [Candidatus Hydrogenedentes bacterium]|nr:methionyl-tRNA formyltransferase [Candidatus Hydrogenedentota bacterium]HPC16264.1 methionyl-tRNA formyltransferase [Candidatus Hydrogenedentota bacterium]HRT21646.1 methionyl-tRNA formyltransferase [Candidatus Hydrogenedentota bacterium]HRT66791.1 methionyl-tRNA formyltransferase [Candidatus Hydrogenedentota bacterium]
MRIAIAGSGRLGWSLMAPLLESNHEVVAVLQDGRRTRGFRRRVMAAQSVALAAHSTMIGLAARNRIPVLWLERLVDESLAPLRALAPDVILVGGFGIIFKPIILSLPKIGCVNCHSSMLPRHRGPNPFAAVILQGETESGVTFHIMDEGIDTGDIIAQYAYPVTDQDTPASVYNNACALAGEHVVDIMDRVEQEGLQGVPQNHAAATYDKPLDPALSKIDWTQPAVHIERIVRVFKQGALARFMFQGREILVSMAKANPAPVEAPPGTVLASGRWVRVATGEGTIDIVLAYKLRPIPWIWPSRWSRPIPGERMG